MIIVCLCFPVRANTLLSCALKDDDDDDDDGLTSSASLLIFVYDGGEQILQFVSSLVDTMLLANKKALKFRLFFFVTNV